MSQFLGTLTITSGTKTQFQEVPRTGARAVVIGNESGLTCVVTMEGGGVQKTLYPGTIDWFDIRQGFTGTVTIVPTAILTNAASFPASELIFDAIGPSDPEQPGQYPIPLQRNTNIGNQGSVQITSGTVSITGNVNVTAATQVSNTTFPVGTVFVFGAPVNDSDVRGATNIQNNGIIVLGDNNYAGQFTLRTSTPASNVQNANQMILTDAAGTTTVSIVGTNTPFLELLDDSAHSVILQTISPALDLSGTTAATPILIANNKYIQAKSVAGVAQSLIGIGNDDIVRLWTESGGTAIIEDPSGSTHIAEFSVANGLALLQGFLNIASNAVSATAHAGSVGGTVTFYTPIWGTGLKVLLVLLGAYNSAAGFNFTLPSTIARGLWIASYNGSSTCAFGSVDVATALGNGTARGADVAETTIFANSFGSIQVTSASAFTVNSTAAVAVNGAVLVIGV